MEPDYDADYDDLPDPGEAFAAAAQDMNQTAAFAGLANSLGSFYRQLIDEGVDPSHAAMITNNFMITMLRGKR